jgi:hypothetical protein
MSFIKMRVVSIASSIMASCLLCGSLLVFVSCQQSPPAPAASSPPAAARPAPADHAGPAVARAHAAPGNNTSGADTKVQLLASAAPAPAVDQPIDYRCMGFTFPAAPTNDESNKNLDRIPRKNAICVVCHKPGGNAPAGHTDSDSMHTTGVNLACVECHGGGARDPNFKFDAANPNYHQLKQIAHVFPTTDIEMWDTARRPVNSATSILKQSPDFVRFTNPGDLRAARVACASCHGEEVRNVPKSMMSTGAMLWGAALYNNGSHNRKNPIYGEAYTEDGIPASMTASKNNWPTIKQVRENGMLPALFPLPRWEITQPGNILRVFERGKLIDPELGIPDIEEDPGRPDVKLSIRGLGTILRTDPVAIGLQKTRLLDPKLGMYGTNDHPGDFRSSGCTACHVVYANDRNPVHSSFWAGFGNRAESFSIDAMVNTPENPKAGPVTRPYKDPYNPAQPREAVHPIKHVFVRNMPTSSCIVCHVHPGTNVLNSYLGFMWWDNETDGWSMYPKEQVNPTSDQEYLASEHNPEAAAARGLWSNLYPGLENHRGQKAGPDFLENIPKLNKDLKHTQFADFHGHGWVFRGVFKQDREGRMLDYAGKPIDPDPSTIAARMAEAVSFQQKPDKNDKDSQAPDKKVRPKANNPVHLKDIHLEKGMQCGDCHFAADVHGNGSIYGETRNAVMVNCADCHGTAEAESPILTYLRDTTAANSKDLLYRAFSGNAAHVGLNKDGSAMSKEDIINRNQKLITDHFEIGGDELDKLVQKNTSYTQAGKIAKLDKDIKTDGMFKSWLVTQTIATLKADFAPPDADKDSAAHHAALARYAHTVRRDGTMPKAGEAVNAATMAHSNRNVSCYACHSSWNTSCFGCHLPQRANQRKAMLHNEGIITRNYTSYNFQTLRDDMFMLGVDSTVKNHVVVPVRSACAVLVSSQNVNRDWIYAQQQTVSAEGFAGVAFSPNFPHTVRAAETKQCSDCHVSKTADNNAIMAALLMQGANAANFIGRYAYVAEGDGGVEAVAVTEHDEPQAVIGSRLQQMAYPANFEAHCKAGGRLTEAYDHHGEVLDVQMRGEYLYAACGPNGFIAYDIANIDNKDFSERIITAPVSPLGQRFYVPSRYATSICSPSTMAVDPARSWTKEDLANRVPGWRDANEEGKITEIGDRTKVIEQHRQIHPLYGFLYLTDREEGLIVIGNALDNKFTGPGVTTLLDGNPRNNFLERALTYNPGNVLKGARHMDLFGTYAYISCDAGLVVVSLENPLAPRIISTPRLAGIRNPRKVQFQFRYGFVIDDDGMKVIDVTFPDEPFLIPTAEVKIRDARDIYISRTYGYIAAGSEGLIILDLTEPKLQRPRQLPWYGDGSARRDMKFNDAGKLNDATAVRIGITNASMFAYIADGKNGLKVVQLTSPDDTPNYAGFSPRPAPRMIAWYPTRGPAICISKGLDRDRAVDESGNQLGVFGRRGSRPFTLPEQRRFYLHDAPAGRKQNWDDFYWVSDTPPGEAK